MFDTAATLAILQWGDSALPAGGFAFSWGVEGLYLDGLISDGKTLDGLVKEHLTRRWATMDRLLLGEAFRASSCEEIAKVDQVVDRDLRRSDARRVQASWARPSQFVGAPWRKTIDRLSRSRFNERRAWPPDCCPGDRLSRSGHQPGGGRAPFGLDTGQWPCQRGDSARRDRACRSSAMSIHRSEDARRDPRRAAAKRCGSLKLHAADRHCRFANADSSEQDVHHLRPNR
jgi:hypothetical protein